MMRFFKTKIYKVIIGIGTFALALAFAGNDLVNFICVPIAAYQSYEAWISSGIPASQFSMESMASKVPTPTGFLVISGLIMVLTLWFSSKARKVLKTSLDLSNQGYVKERFEPSLVSKLIVKFFQKISSSLVHLIPKKINNKIETQFSRKNLKSKISNDPNAPSFDMLRASVNLTVASILISSNIFNLSCKNNFSALTLARG